VEIPWDEVQQIVLRITTSNWWLKRRLAIVAGLSFAASPVPVNVTDGRGRRVACASGNTIKLPRWARTMWVILHELTHVMSRERPAHGRAFARTYIDMVNRWMGPGEAARLRECFGRNHVHWKGKERKARVRKPLTDEQRAAMLERMAKMRAMRKSKNAVSESV